MSFWPFSNAFNSNTQLQKFLDGIQDFSIVKVDDLLEDANLLQELVNELHNIKGNYNNANGFQFLQVQQLIPGHNTSLQLQDPDDDELPAPNLTLNLNQTQNQNQNQSLALGLSPNSNLAINSDISDSHSINSSNAETNTNTKDSRNAKLIELLLQPHILNGFLDYIYKSVDFFQELTDKENEELAKLLEEKDDDSDDKTKDTNGNESSNQSSNNSTLTLTAGNDDEIEVEEQEDFNDSNDISMAKSDIIDDNEDEDLEEETQEEKMRRCIQVSADILSIELWVILNRIIETPIIIDKLWLILYLKNLNESSPSVTHLVHILDQLMDTNSIELLNFVRNRDDLVDTFVGKLEVPMLMDFFLRIIQSDKPDSPTGIIETLYTQGLIPKLIDILKPDPSQFITELNAIPNHELFFRQTAATDFLKALITISSNTALAVVIEANIGPNQLTRQLVSEEIVSQMVKDIMLYTMKIPGTNSYQTNKHGINNCVGIVIELIRKNNSDYDLNCGSYSQLLQTNNGENNEVNSYVMFQWLKDFEQNVPGPRDPIYLGEMLAIFSDNLDKFCDLMDLTPELPSKVDPESNILGFTKFRISELIAELLHCSNMILINSKKIRKIVEVRDRIREKQGSRLYKALNDPLVDHSDFDSGDEETNTHNENDDATTHKTSHNAPVKNLSQNLEDISLEEVSHPKKLSSGSVEQLLNGENEDFNNLISSFDIDDESDDEEPTISSENPFVCKARDDLIRSNASIGDYFKIKLLDSNILMNILSKFTEYPWHNFFHNVVFDLIQQIFNGKLNSYNSFLISNLFKDDKHNLTQIIVDAYKQDFDLRPGYLGHLILISEEVVKFTSLYKPDLISPMIVDSINSNGWSWFVNEVLLKTREVYNVVLGAETDDRVDGLDDSREIDDIDEEDNEDGEDEDYDNDNGIAASDKHHNSSQENESYGFDSSTVGFLDIDADSKSHSGSKGKSKRKTKPKTPKRTLLDEECDNENEISRTKNRLDDDDDDEYNDNGELMSTMSDVRIQDMSPKPEDMHHHDDPLSDEYDQEVGNFSQDGFLENLSGSSSDEDEDEAMNSKLDDNKLTRVKNHNS